MRILHFGLRVADLHRSLAFYAAVGYEIVGNAPETGMGHPTVLNLPGGEFVTIELVHYPSESTVDGGTRPSRFGTHSTPWTSLSQGSPPAASTSKRPHRPRISRLRTTWIVDPDGNRIELVQWPAGHADGITAADWAR